MFEDLVSFRVTGLISLSDSEFPGSLESDFEVETEFLDCFDVCLEVGFFLTGGEESALDSESDASL